MTNEAGPFQDRSYIRLLWLSLLAGPVVWAAYFFSGYLLNEVACTAGLLRSTILGLPLLPVLTVVYTLLALGLVIYAGLWAYRQWQPPAHRQQLGSEPGGSKKDGSAAGEEIEVWDRTRFMTFAGMLLSLLFGITILLTGIPSLVLRPCG
jgi:hypothetical protein